MSRLALVALAVFVCSFAVLLLLILNAVKLSGLELTDHVYYIVLVLTGISAAVVLFGVLPSSATFAGTILGGNLRLGGAIVGAALVVAGGYFFRPAPTTFPLTVYVHGAAGPQDVLLRNSGRVVLELGLEPRSQPIGDNGQAFFPAIPAGFRGQEVFSWVESEEYESIDPRAKYKLAGNTLQMVVHKKILHYPLGGTISDQNGDPLPEVLVSLPEYHLQTKTDGQGRFDFRVEADGQRTADLVAQKNGYRTEHLSPTLGDSGVKLLLKRAK